MLAWDAPSLSYEADVDAKLDFAATPITVAAKVEPVSVQKSAGASAKAGFSFGTK